MNADLYPYDTWWVSQGLSHIDSFAELARLHLEVFLKTGDDKMFADPTLFYTAHAAGDMALAGSQNTDALFHHRCSAAAINVLLSQWSRCIRYHLPAIRELISSPAADCCESVYQLQLMGVVAEPPELWRSLRPLLLEATVRLSVSLGVECPQPRTKRAALSAIKKLLREARRQTSKAPSSDEAT